MDCNMKRIISYFSTLLLCSLAVVSIISCQKRFVMDTPLLVDRAEFYVDNVSGSTTFTVWSNTGWTADFENPVNWARLEVVDNGSLTGVRVHYDDNTGISRGVNIVVKAGDAMQKVYFAQKAGMSAPMLVFDKSSVSLLKMGCTLELTFNTNLSEDDLAKTGYKTNYTVEGDTGGWVKEFKMEKDKAVIVIDDNVSGADRSVVIDVEVPGAYSGEGAGSTVTINQAREDVEVSFNTQETVLEGMAQDFSIGCKINFDTELYKDYTVKCGFAGADGQDVSWISGAKLSSSALQGHAKVNIEAVREAQAYIEVFKNGESFKKATSTVKQNVTDAKPADGEDDEQQDKDDPENF